MPRTLNSQVVDEWVRVGDAEIVPHGPSTGTPERECWWAAPAARPSPRLFGLLGGWARMTWSLYFARTPAVIT